MSLKSITRNNYMLKSIENGEIITFEQTTINDELWERLENMPEKERDDFINEAIEEQCLRDSSSGNEGVSNGS